MISGRVRADDGTELATRFWPAEGPQPPWAAVVIVHGLGEHAGRWEHVGRWLASEGIDVHAYDQRGFGLSGGRRAWVDRWSQLHEDLGSRVAAVRDAQPGLPLALYGHSLGGVVALGAHLDGRALADMLVLSAPGLDVSIPAWKRWAAVLLDRVRPTTDVANGFDPATLSRDRTIQELYRSDPMNHHFTTAHFARQGILEQERLRKILGRLATPTLVLHSADDRLVATASSEPFEALPAVTRRLYTGLRHELHNEPEGRQVIGDIVAWMRQQVRSDGDGRLPASADR
jgi:alpha-beta hydrolase superfamily lysophospholipase